MNAVQELLIAEYSQLQSLPEDVNQSREDLLGELYSSEERYSELLQLTVQVHTFFF